MKKLWAHFEQIWKKENKKQSQYKKWSFSLGISSVYMNKSEGNCGFGHIYWRNPWWRTSFFVQWIKIICNASFVFKMKSCVLNKFSSSVEQSVSIIDYFAQASLTKFCTANIFRIKRADIKNMKSFSRFMVKYSIQTLQFSPVGRDMSTLEA